MYFLISCITHILTLTLKLFIFILISHTQIDRVATFIKLKIIGTCIDLEC